MLRPKTLLLFHLMFALTLVGVGNTRAQQLAFQALVDAFCDYPLHCKELAKAKFEASRSDLKDLVRAKLAAAREECEYRAKEFQTGRGTLDILLGSALRRLESELAASDEQADQIAALERQWELAKEIEDISKGRYEAGRVTIQEYSQTRYFRLDAEIRLGRARAKTNKPVREGPGLVTADPLRSKWLSKTKLEASPVNVTELAIAKVDAARTEYAARFKEFEAGRGLLCLLSNASVRVLESELALHGEQATQVSYLEKAWMQRKLVEDITKAQHDAGRMPTKDYLETKYNRLEAEMLLAQARAKTDRPIPSVRATRGPVNAADPLEGKELANGLLEAAHPDPRDLAKSKMEAAAMIFRSRYWNFMAGIFSLDLLLEWSLHWLESELALGDKQADRIAAYERHWVLTKVIESRINFMYEHGRVPVQDYMQSKYFRLQAERWLAQARAKTAGR